VVGNVEVVAIDRKGVNNLCHELTTRVETVVENANVVIWYDEISILFYSPNAFVALANFQQENIVGTRQNCFYGAMVMMADMAEEYKWKQAMCGTYLEIWKKANVSPCRHCVIG